MFTECEVCCGAVATVSFDSSGRGFRAVHWVLGTAIQRPLSDCGAVRAGDNLLVSPEILAGWPSLPSVTLVLCFRSSPCHFSAARTRSTTLIGSLS